MKTTTTVELELVCLHCGAPAKSFTSVLSDDSVPEPGMCSICLECAGVQVFDADMRYRFPTVMEKLLIDSHPLISKARDAVKGLIQRRGAVQ